MSSSRLRFEKNSLLPIKNAAKRRFDQDNYVTFYITARVPRRCWWCRSAPARRKPSPRRRLLRQAAGQRGFFTDAVEVVGGGDFFDHLRDNALAQHQLMRGGLVGGQRQDHRVREVFTHGFR